MDELIAEVDPRTGAVVGEVSRAGAHRDGVWHATIHVWILDAENRLIFQHRSPHKEHWADAWDVTVGGHIRHGEDGTREVAEELGVNVNIADLHFAGIATLDTALPVGRDREKARVYLWRSSRLLDSFTFSDGEVVGLAAVELRDVENLLAGSRVSAMVFDGTSVAPGSLDYRDLVPLPSDYWALLRRALGQIRR